jgi:hypothetical protein
MAAHGPLNTRHLAVKVMATKGLNTGDKVLAKAVAGRLISALRQQYRQRAVSQAISGRHRHGGYARGLVGN